MSRREDGGGTGRGEGLGLAGEAVRGKAELNDDHHQFAVFDHVAAGEHMRMAQFTTYMYVYRESNSDNFPLVFFLSLCLC
jgi:hypothetical protein